MLSPSWGTICLHIVQSVQPVRSKDALKGWRGQSSSSTSFWWRGEAMTHDNHSPVQQSPAQRKSQSRISSKYVFGLENCGMYNYIKENPTVKFSKLLKVLLFLVAADKLVCVHSALLKPEAISAVWVSYLAEAITAECYSDYVLLLEAMKGEEQESSSSNNTRNNRLSQPRGSESLAVRSRTSPTSLPTDSRLWLMQLWI